MIQLHFQEILPNIADWLQVIFSFLTFLTAVVMAIIAWKALSSWKNQKHYEIYLDEIAYLSAYTYLYYEFTYKLRIEILMNLEEHPNQEIADNIRDIEKKLLQKELYHRFIKSKTRINELYDNKKYTVLLSQINEIDEGFNKILNETKKLLNIFMSEEELQLVLEEIIKATPEISYEDLINLKQT